MQCQTLSDIHKQGSLGMKKDKKEPRLLPVEQVEKPELPWPMRAHRMGVTLPCADYADLQSLEFERRAKEALKAIELGIEELRRCMTTSEHMLIVAKAITACERHLWAAGRSCPIRTAAMRQSRDHGKHQADPVNTERLSASNNFGTEKKPH
jgi:hypothetical protein